MLESDLFEPLKEYLEAAGYTVRAEVKNCDITATKTDEIVIIELKLNLNIHLLIQATDRQRISDSVYVAVPVPSKRAQHKRLKGIKHILRRLEIGLIFVNLSDVGDPIQIIFHPTPFQRRKAIKRKQNLLSEISQRTGNFNKAGISKKKIVTAYRENVIEVAVYLNALGSSSPKNLKQLGTSNKTPSILSSNFYKWFTRIERGVYELNSKGKKEMMQWPDLVDKYVLEFEKNNKLIDKN